MRDSERDRVFDEWLACHKGIMFKVVHAHAESHADREDLFQEIAVQLWRSADAFRGDSSVATWIYRVALNTAISWNRKEGRHQRGKQPLESAADVLVAPAPGGPDSRVEWLHQEIATLNDADRSLALLMLDGCSYREMADITGITENYVGVKINRLKSTLAGMARDGTVQPPAGGRTTAALAEAERRLATSALPDTAHTSDHRSPRASTW